MSCIRPMTARRTAPRPWRPYCATPSSPPPLHLGQRVMAAAGGYCDWEHLRRTLDKGVRRPVELEGFLRRMVLALPEQAVGPSYRWAEGIVSDLKARAG